MPPHRSAFAFQVHGQYARWTDETHLAAVLLDAERVALWQRAGGKGMRPRPIERPKDKAIKRLSTKELQKDRMQTGVIGTAKPFAEIQAWLHAVNGV